MSCFFRCVFSALLPLLLGGCFEVAEDIVIRKDASARLELEVTMSGSLAMIAGGLDKAARDPFGDSSRLVRDLKAAPGVEDVDYKERKDGTKRIHHLTIEVDHYRSLRNVGALLMKYQKERIVDGSLLVQDISPSSARITQRFVGHQVDVKTPAKVQGMPVNSLMQGKEGEAREYLLGRLEDKYIFVTLRAPAIGDSNGEMNKAGTIVSWEVPLTAVLESPGTPIDLAADITVVQDDRPLWKRLLFFWR